MHEIENNRHLNDIDDQIDFREIFFVLLKGKRIIVYLTTFFLVVGIIYSLFTPNVYESEALLAPLDKDSSLISGGLDQYSGLAALAGINLSSGDATSNSKKAIEVMNSLSFFENYVLPKIFLPDLMAVKYWDENNNKIIYDESIFIRNSNNWVGDSSDSEMSIPSAQKSFEVFKDDHFDLFEDKSGFVVLSMKHQSPTLAKEWIEIFVEEINSFYRLKDKEQSKKAVNFLNKQISETSLLEIRQVTASILEKEIQKLTLIEANPDYVFEYIYPPSVMEEKSEPKRVLIIILSILFGSMLGIIVVLFRHFFILGKNVEKKASI